MNLPEFDPEGIPIPVAGIPILTISPIFKFAPGAFSITGAYIWDQSLEPAGKENTLALSGSASLAGGAKLVGGNEKAIYASVSGTGQVELKASSTGELIDDDGVYIKPALSAGKFSIHFTGKAGIVV